MRSFALLALASSAMAVAIPQGADGDFLDFDVIDALGDQPLVEPPMAASNSTPTYNAAAAVQAAVADASANPVSNSTSDDSSSKRSLSKRYGSCAAQPAGAANYPASSPDTVDAFLNDVRFSNAANGAGQAPGYSTAFTNLPGSTMQNAIGWKNFDSYDVDACQEFCDGHDTACWAFNIYFERDPAFDPCTATPNPPSLVNIKCVLYGAQISSETATNEQQGRGGFTTAVAGSNGYNKLAAPANQPGFDAPTSLAGSINAPDGSYMGAKIYPGPYNAAQCTAACTTTTSYNSRHPASDGSYNTCTFVNSYVLYKNGNPQGTYCGLYSAVWGEKQATNFGQYRGSDHYVVGQSYGWPLSQAQSAVA